MEKSTPTTDSDQSASHNAVFVDTSLSTHLAVLVSDSDTVSDLKKKIMHEHVLCFPKIGEIEIHALKVKRRGHFYRLSETMLVRSAFLGVHKNWFIAVDASRSVEECNGDPSFDNIIPLAICDGTGNNLACEKHCKSLSSVRQDESNQCVKQKVPVDDPQVVEILKRGVENLGHDHGMMASLETNKIVGTVCQEVLKESGSGDVEGSGAFDGAPETEPHSKRKNKSKKKKRSIQNLYSKEDDISVDEFSRKKLDRDTTAPEIYVGHGGGVVSPGTQMGVKIIADGPSLDLPSDANKASDVIEKGTDNLNLGAEVSREHVQFKDVQCAESLKEPSKSESPAKKKHKTENKKGGNQKSRNYSANGVTAETLEGVHLQSAFPSSPKTNRGRKSMQKSLDLLLEEAIAIPSPKTNVRVERSRDEVATNAKILDQDPDAASLHGLHAQHAILSEQFASLPKENNHDPLGEPHQRASKDISVSEVDAGNTESRHDYSKIVTVSAAEQIRCKSPNAIEVVPYFSPVTKESNNIEKDVGLSVLDNIYEVPASEQAYVVENEGELSKHISPKIRLPTESQPSGQAEIGASDYLEASETLDPKKSSKKRRKSHKTRGLVSETQATPGTEHGKHSKSDISASEPCETVNEDHTRVNGNNVSVLAMDSEFNEMIPNIVESAQQNTENQMNAENIDEKSKKKSKRKQSSNVDGRLFDDVIPDVVESAQQNTENQVNVENIDGKSKKKSKRKQNSDPDGPLKLESEKKKDKSEKDRISTSLLATDRELDEVIIQNEVDSVQQRRETQVNAGNMDRKSRKKSKSKHSSDSKSQHKLQSEIEDVGHRTPDMGTGKVDTLTDKDNNEENNMPLKKGKEVWEKDSFSTSPTGVSAQQKGEALVHAENLDQKSRKKSKRKLTLDPKIQSKLQSEIEDVGHKSSDVDTKVVDSSADKFHNGESNVPLKEGKALSHLDMVNSSVLVTSRETDDDIIKNVVEFVQQMGETEVNGDNVNRKSREKTKKKRSLVSSTDNTKEVDSSSELMWRAHLTNVSSPKQLDGSNSVHEQDTMAENEDLGAQVNSTAIESSLAHVHELGRNLERRDLGNANDNEQKWRHADESPSNMEATCGSNGINFNDYFVPKQCHHETVASGEVLVAENTKVVGANNEKKAEQSKPLLEGHSGSGVKAPQSSKSDELNSIAEGAKRHAKASGGSPYTTNNKEIFSTSNSLGSPKSRNLQNKSVDGHKWHEVHIDGRKASAVSAAKAGEVVNSSRHGKSLIGTSGAIFKDDSYGSSADEDLVDNSGSSTRTPSDNSVTSDYTDGESDIDFNSPQNGSDSLKRKEDVARNIRSSGVTLDTILRSSSRYKLVKLTASQSQLEETESQPVDFVPDSQANY